MLPQAIPGVHNVPVVQDVQTGAVVVEVSVCKLSNCGLDSIPFVQSTANLKSSKFAVAGVVKFSGGQFDPVVRAVVICPIWICS